MTQKAYAKVNVFLKILGTRGNYHELSSRFVQVNSLYDTLTFSHKEKENAHFALEGDFGCPLEKNTIYKAYLLLKKEVPKIENFFKTHKLTVDKKIPEFAGLGGGSSDAATFLRLTNQTLSLGLSPEALASIGAKIGADVPFFVYNYTTANVSGIGEIVKPFEEEALNIQTFTPKIACDTAKVYTAFREGFLKDINIKKAKTLEDIPSQTLLQNEDAIFLNDLFAPALSLYPKLRDYHDNNFFSGSGSTFFRSLDG